MGEKLTIAINIDGTIADASEVNFLKADEVPLEFMKAKPIAGALEAVIKRHAEGNTIVFHKYNKGWLNDA